VEELRRVVIILAKSTGWGLAELLDLELDELRAWSDSAEWVENEIAEAMRKA
jgi:hypothetical protein